MVKLITKNAKVRLCKGLTSLEFQCKCKFEACRATVISKKLIKSYKRFRELVGVPLVIKSGFRCTQHNFDEGGVSKSRHFTGEAIDIGIKSLNHLTREEIEFAAKEAGFTFIKFYKSFVHLDVRE